MYCSLESFSDAFDLLIVGYIYSCFVLVLLLFIGQTTSTLALARRDCSGSSRQSDFYQQVKELLDTDTDTDTDLIITDLNSVDLANDDEGLVQTIRHQFETSTIRELRAYIKKHQLQRVIGVQLGKSVSVANKLELITCLNSITSQ